MITRRSTLLLLCAVALAACDKNGVQDITEAPQGGAAIKFYNLAVGAPSVNFYAGDKKMTAISSGTGVESTSGTAYGSAAAGDHYTDLAPGQYTLSARITAETDHGLAIASVPVTIDAGQHYSFYLSGFYDPTTKTVDAFVVSDPIPENFDYDHAYIRFVNAISNSTPMTLYARSQDTGAEVAIGGDVAYKSAGAFTAIPPGVYTLSTRTAGSSTDAITRSATAFGAGGVYTISARGDMTVTSSSAPTRPILDSFRNR
ncbi:MAG: DUF4397 domain-containing protein [Gemmatimonadetes bacterium]|nr:DUF4397 domain-containing protein [Gemmatimonadota bacterium]